MFHAVFGNGTKALGLAFVGMIVSFIALGLVYTTTRPEPPGLCEYGNPREVLPREISVGGVVTEKPIRCVRGNQIIQVKTYRSFINLEDNRTIVDLDGQLQNRGPGKQVYSDVPITLPLTIYPGTWRLAGYDEYPKTGDRSYWFSEAFRVVP